MNIPHKLRAFISKQYLKVARRMPKSQVGCIRSLQQRQCSSRKRAVDDAVRCTPPEKDAIEILFFRLFEVFPIEDFEKLEKELLKLFPSLSASTTYQGFRSDFNRRSTRLQGSEWCHIGVIYPKKNDGEIPLGIYGELKKLPEEVVSIEVQLFHLLPSLIAISFDVFLTQEASLQLSNNQAKEYEPAIAFKNLMPWKVGKAGYHFTSPSSERERAISQWFDTLRLNVEKALEPYLSGHFLRKRRKNKSKLPAVEVFSLKYLPCDEPQREQWLKDANQWLKSMGIEIYRAFQGESFSYLSSSEIPLQEELNWQHRLIVHWDSFVQTLDADETTDSKNVIIGRIREEFLYALSVRIIILEYLKDIQRQIEILRKTVFRNMGVSRKLKKHLRLNHTLLKTSLLLERTTLELKTQRKLIYADAQPLSALREMNRFQPNTDPNANLYNATVNAVKYQAKLLASYLVNLKSNFNDFVSQQNIRITYRLQLIVIGLTIFAIIVSILGLIANWPGIKLFLCDVFGIKL